MSSFESSIIMNPDLSSSSVYVVPPSVGYYMEMPKPFLLKIQNIISSVPTEVEKATGLSFLRATDGSDVLVWPVHYKIIDEKKWALTRLKYGI